MISAFLSFLNTFYLFWCMNLMIILFIGHNQRILCYLRIIFYDAHISVIFVVKIQCYTIFSTMKSKKKLLLNILFWLAIHDWNIFSVNNLYYVQMLWPPKILLIFFHLSKYINHFPASLVLTWLKVTVHVYATKPKTSVSEQCFFCQLLLFLYDSSI